MLDNVLYSFLFLFSVAPIEAMSEEQLATEKPRDHRPKKWIAESFDEDDNERKGKFRS